MNEKQIPMDKDSMVFLIQIQIYNTHCCYLLQTLWSPHYHPGIMFQTQTDIYRFHLLCCIEPQLLNWKNHSFKWMGPYPPFQGNNRTIDQTIFLFFIYLWISWIFQKYFRGVNKCKSLPFQAFKKSKTSVPKKKLLVLY